MCESNVYVLRNGKEELVMADVATIEPRGDVVVLGGILGKPLEVKARLFKLDLMAHKILLIEGPAAGGGCGR